MTRLTWEAVSSLTDDLARIIRDDTFQPNLIIAVARGGFIPARLLSSRLNVKRMGSIGITYEGSARKTPRIYNISGPIDSTDRILLVEDALETGRSLADAREKLSSDAAAVHTVAYFYRPDSVITPDYSIRMISRLPEFPWE
jgi:uncharacterized protein